MEKYRNAKENLMALAIAYRAHGISCESIYDEIANKLSGVRIVASCDPELTSKEYNEIAEMIGNCIQVLLDEYRKELGLEDKQ